MRVLLVNDWVADEGGMETYLLGLRELLRAAGDEVRLLTSSAGSAANGSADYTAFGARSVVPQIGLQVVNPSAVRRAREAVRDFRPDVAHVSMFEMHLSPAVIGALGSTPTVLNVGYYKPICPNGLKLWPDGRLCTVQAGIVCWRSGCLSMPHWLRDRPRYALIRAALRKVDRVVTCSRWMERQLALAGVEAESLAWPIPASPGFRRTRSAEPLFVYTGRLSPEKGVSLLFRAFARLKQSVPMARLRIVGDGPERLSLNRLASALQLDDVDFTGRVQPRVVDRLLTDAWALVAPSLWAEPFGQVAGEAVVRGVPAIVSATGGLAETIEDGVSGLLFENGDEEGLADCLERIAKGQVFEDGSLPEDVIESVRVRHDPARHLDRVRAMFAEVAA